MGKKKLFEDGSSVEWIDRETLRYRRNGFSALIWVDFEPGFFTNGRIIRSSSLKNWETVPPGRSIEISAEERQEIIDKIKLYFQSFHKKFRVE